MAGLTNRPFPRGHDSTKRSRGELPLLLAKHRSVTAVVADLMERFRPSDYDPTSLFRYALTIIGPSRKNHGRRCRSGVVRSHVAQHDEYDAGIRLLRYNF